MFAAVLVSLSRSAATGVTAAAIVGGGTRSSATAQSRKWLLAAMAVAALVFVSIRCRASSRAFRPVERQRDRQPRADLGGDAADHPRLRDRRNGLGTYRMTMLVYQRTDRDVLFNQAHDEYLQQAAEGGLLVGVPLLLAAIVLLAGVVRRLRHDVTNGFWIRAGAAASLAGIAIQNIWETGLRMPANGLLFAVICAVAIRGSGTGRRGDG